MFVRFLLLMLLTLPSMARVRLLNDPVFLSDLHGQRWEFIAQGSSFTLAEDHTRMETAGGLTYGLSKNLHFGFGFPFISESLGNQTKSGQGDLEASLCWTSALGKSEQLKWGARQTLLFPTGFREELEGIEAFSEKSTRSETLVLLELDQPRFTLDGHAGFSMDDRRENPHSLWGVGVRGKLWREWLMLEMELGQDLDLGDKLYDYQFYGGVRSNLPFGLTFKLGAEQRLVDNLDHFGVYAGLTWHLQHRDPVKIRSRHLRESIRYTLEQRNQQPGFSLEPGSDATPAVPAGQWNFKPVRLVILPLADPSGYPVSDVLWQTCLNRFDSDSSLSVVPRDRVDQARERLGYPVDLQLGEEQQRALGASLDADFVVSGRILTNQPAERSGLDLAPLFSRTRLSSLLEAQLLLLEVGNGAVHYKGIVSSKASTGSSTRWFAVKQGHGDASLPATHRSRLLTRTLEQWSQSALDELFYEYSVQMVVQ
jgi:hypothetical protein